jgi:hypothetical protein
MQFTTPGINREEWSPSILNQLDIELAQRDYYFECRDFLT